MQKHRYTTDGVVLRPCVTAAGDSAASEADDNAPLTVDRRKPVSVLLALLSERCVDILSRARHTFHRKTTHIQQQQLRSQPAAVAITVHLCLSPLTH